MAFNEDTRVKIPALIHFTRLGYTYFSLSDSSFTIDPQTNILTNVFLSQLRVNNPDATEDDIAQELQNIQSELNFDDLGRSFYHRLQGTGEGKLQLIDWQHFDLNTFHITTELTCQNGEDEFRPDITVFINGMPLAFIEVKKPNNHEGIRAERDRIHVRFKNDKFRRFVNITQLLVFSNNMEYDDADLNKLQGAYYATTAKDADTHFNHFREQKSADFVDLVHPTDETIENYILSDTNRLVIKHSPEFISNKDALSPTNRLLSSLFCKNRVKDMLRYGLCYVEEIDEDTGVTTIQKHVMRYPQFFATKAIKAKLDDGTGRGVIWHTQGSGKTALAYYNVASLTDYFSLKGVIPNFYFIVDRLDLATQAKDEFSKRGMKVRSIDSKEALLQDFAYNAAYEGIAVVNIHKFREETTTLRNSRYDITVQKVFFIDEAHRSYDPHGSFLANLYSSDTNSIKIALTGTPLIIYRDHEADGDIADVSEKVESKTTRNIFGNYFHKYYYNDSIRDGYTLKLLREEIETSYKEMVQGVIRDIQIQSGGISKTQLYAHPQFVAPMLAYIVNDFIGSRIRFGDKSIGGMIVCDSSAQAREMYRLFNESASEHKLTAALILHDEDDKETRKKKIKLYKKGKLDFLFVYSMLLTGFDAPRLKKLYLGRKIKAHNLLQTLTRVNRPYKDFKLGYVVDFADISAEFEVTNQAYFRELKEEYSENLDNEDPSNIFGSLFMSQAEIDQQIETAQNAIADFCTDNLETFSSQITAIDDRGEILSLRNALRSAQEVYNVARLQGYTELLEKLDFKLLAELLHMVSDRLKLLNLKEAMQDISSTELLNSAIENVIFTFIKTGEEELRLLSEDLHNIAGNTRRELDKYGNQNDPEWVNLYHAFLELLHAHHIDPNAENIDTMRFESEKLRQIFEQIREYNRRQSMLISKFKGDHKYARVFKKVVPSGKVSDNMPLHMVLSDAKKGIEIRLGQSQNLLDNSGYFRQMVGEEMFQSFENHQYHVEATTLQSLIEYTADEYFGEYSGNNV